MPEIPQIVADKLRPGGHYVMLTPRFISRDFHAGIQKQWEDFWAPDPAPRLLVLEDGIELRAVEGEPVNADS